jgi:L-alanine-DL-glutamate epimerase-like enolase superfamily enzyme
MRPSRLGISSAPIPFRSSFGHASATRDRAENVLVFVEDANGSFGLGEGCPRVYVTGETVETARSFLVRHRQAFLELDSMDALTDWMTRNAEEIDVNPSAFCAAELALLDLFARQRRESVERLLGLEPLARSLTTTAVYGTGAWLKFMAQALLFRANGMRDAKLKLSGDARRDVGRAAFLARRGRVRLDANNLWKDIGQAVGALSAIAPHAWAVEEPVGVRDWRGMSEVGAHTKLDIIVDESCTRVEDLDAMPAGGGFIPNLRVSKLGGLVRSLAALRSALDQHRKIIVGAQVGETSVLARAGVALAAAAGDHLVGYEGAYGGRLLKWDIATPSIVFARDGVVDLSAMALAPEGLGLQPSAAFEAKFR